MTPKKTFAELTGEDAKKLKKLFTNVDFVFESFLNNSWFDGIVDRGLIRKRDLDSKMTSLHRSQELLRITAKLLDSSEPFHGKAKKAAKSIEAFLLEKYKVWSRLGEGYYYARPKTKAEDDEWEQKTVHIKKKMKVEYTKLMTELISDVMTQLDSFIAKRQKQEIQTDGVDSD